MKETKSATTTEASLIVRMADTILTQALYLRASDIHLLPQPDKLVLRMRVDGLLQDVIDIPKKVQRALVQRFKTMAEITPINGFPLTGSITLPDEAGKYIKCTIKVICNTSAWGEVLTLHILEHESLLVEPSHLGMLPDDEARVKAMMTHPGGGLLLIAGTSGSGITTTAISCLQIRNSPANQIVTISAVPEYQLSGVTHVHTEYAGSRITPASILRGSRYQDIDILLLEDIVDVETAQCAIAATLRGVLVIATMKARDVATAMLRWREFGISESQLEQSVRGVTAQRLLRRVCTECQGVQTKSESSSGVACEKCGGQGYRGRFGVFEVLSGITPDADFVSLRSAAAEAMNQGKATQEEIQRVFGN